MLVQVLSELAQRLVHDSTTITDALHGLVDAAPTAFGVPGAGAGAGVLPAHQDTLTFVTAASEAGNAVEGLQERTQSGPSVDAHHSSTPVILADLRSQDHWPVMAEVAVGTGWLLPPPSTSACACGIPSLRDGG